MDRTIRRLAVGGLMAALCFVGYSLFPAISAAGTKVHVGNAFVVLGALLLGGLNGGLAGAIGLSVADLIGGYAASAPRTFICKLVIGLVAGLIAHRLGRLTKQTDPKRVLGLSAAAAIGSLVVNCVFEPALKYVWYTVLFANADKAEGALRALMAVTTYATLINAVINSVLAIVLYNALRPALKKAGVELEGLYPSK